MKKISRAVVPSLLLALTLALAGCSQAPVRPDIAPRPALKFSYPSANRIALAVTADERAYLLNEMRYYLDMLWVMTDSLAYEDVGTVATAARGRLKAVQPERMPPGLERKMPSDYQAYWTSTNKMIDDLAVHAESGGTPHSTLLRVSQLIQRCNECHALYQYKVQ